MFKKAVKHEAKLRMAIIGPSGAGKTYTALAIGTELANGGKVALVDTEHGSASKYADMWDFDVMELQAPFHPERFMEAVREAEGAGYSVLVLDSLSHAWNGPGGLLEIKEALARKSQYNDYTAWGPAGEIQNRLVETINGCRIHLIATMRSKMKYAMETAEEGNRQKTKVVKLGMEPIQRNDFEYEFDVIGDMDIENYMEVTKTRCPALTGKVFKQPGKEVASILIDWLHGAEKPDPLIAMQSARTGEEWAHAAYDLVYVRSAFEAPGRVLDWRNYLTGGNYDAGNNAQLAQILSDYCSSVLDGMKMKQAAQRALESFRPLFGEDEEE